MEILYISGLCSEKRINNLYKRTGQNPGFAMQKFNRLIAKGLASCDNHVYTLSAPPIRSTDNNKLFKWKSDIECGVTYHYIPFINYPILRHLCLFIYTFFYVLQWGIHGRNNKVVVCDMLAISINIATICACKLNRLRSIGILTDMPGLMIDIENDKPSIVSKCTRWVNKRYLSAYSGYVFLTQAMNSIINKYARPYIIIEGLVDNQVSKDYKSGRHKSIIYAGGLHEKYGLIKLVEAFKKLRYQDVTLDIFGDGQAVERILQYAENDTRIRYHGIRPNEEVVEAEKNATLLINPRPTDEQFTKYSFPSKNMEYMLSGTPVLSTRLPGMPTEYYPYVYLIEDETVEGIYKSIDIVLSIPPQDLKEKGKLAQQWVTSNKNYIKQASRIVSLIKDI